MLKVPCARSLLRLCLGIHEHHIPRDVGSLVRLGAIHGVHPHLPHLAVEGRLHLHGLALRQLRAGARVAAGHLGGLRQGGHGGVGADADAGGSGAGHELGGVRIAREAHAHAHGRVGGAHGRALVLGRVLGVVDVPGFSSFVGGLGRGVHLERPLRVSPDEHGVEVAGLLVAVRLDGEVPAVQPACEARVFRLLEVFGQHFVRQPPLVPDYEPSAVGKP